MALATLMKAGDVGALDVVDVAVGSGAVHDAFVVDVEHYLLEFGVDFVAGPE